MPILSLQDKKELITLDRKKLTVPLIIKLFRPHANSKGELIQPKFNIKDTLTLEAHEYINTEKIQTTVGRVLWNKLIIEDKIDKFIPGGFINEAVTAKVVSKIFNSTLANALKNKKITTDEAVLVLKDFEFWMLKLVFMFSPSFTPGVIFPHPEVIEEKKKLLASLPKNPSLSQMTDVEDKLVSLAAQKLKNDPGMYLYDSGARGNFQNDYKNMNIMIGPMMNPATGKYELMASDYTEGISKVDIPNAGNGTVSASFPKGVGTRVGGYQSKQLNSGLQSVQIDKDENSDCGSIAYITRTITEDNYNNYEFQNVIIGDNPRTFEPLDETTKNKYLGKTVKLRTPMGCLNDSCCAACAGNRYYMYNIYNAGLGESGITQEFVNKQMKKFHVAKIFWNATDIDSLLIPV